MFGFGRGRGFGWGGRPCIPKECICVSCGYIEKVPPGKPCRSVKCPRCGAPMVRYS